MEEMNNINVPSQSPTLKPNIFKYLFIISTVVLLVSIVYSVLVTRNANSKKESTEQNRNLTEVVPTVGSNLNKEEIKFNLAKNMASYSFKYPFGWHVADVERQTGDKDNNLRLIIINSEPINTGGHGGPAGDIVIFDKSSLENAKEVFQKDISEFKKTYSDAKEEILESENGKIYHYTVSGVSEMSGPYNLDRYYLFIESKMTDVNKNINEHILYIETYIPEYSSFLKEIATSIKLL